jgi:hypothetical protein
MSAQVACPRRNNRQPKRAASCDCYFIPAQHLIHAGFGGLNMKRMDLIEGVFISMVSLSFLALVATITAFVLS